jgi:hypothetical protein
MTTSKTPHIDQVREHLMQTLADLRNREQPMEVDRARAVAQVASVLVDTARVEVDYLKHIGEGSRFLGGDDQVDDTPRITNTPTGVLHRLKG